MLGRKKNFMLYLDNPDLRMDNNPAERALRAFPGGVKDGQVPSLPRPRVD